jgi:hypothetical protein
MTKVTALLFCADKPTLQRVKDTILKTLKCEFNPKAKSNVIQYSKEHNNFYCYINVEVGKELGYLTIPSETPAKQIIVLKEAGKDAK